MKKSPRTGSEAPAPASRRTFLRHAALGALATMGSGALVRCAAAGDDASCGDTSTADLAGDLADTRDTSGTPATAWDREVDVVVIGAGSGLVGALAAQKAGSTVLVLEKSDAPGGSTRMSGGVAWIPNNNVQKAAGMTDTRDDALTYVRAVARGQASDEIVEAFVDHGPEMVDFVAENTDLVWTVSQILGDYHPEWPGALFRGRSVQPKGGSGLILGPMMIDPIAEAFTAAGGEILLSTPVTRLVTRTLADGTREVTGVLAATGDTELRIRARQGVVLTAGGFDWDDELKRHFLRGPSAYTLGHVGNTGDGLRLSLSVGADVRNLNEAFGALCFKEESEALKAEGKPTNLNAMVQRRMPGCITVNRYGQRFFNEAASYDASWRAVFGWDNFGELADRNVPAFHIADKKVKPTATVGVQLADTLAELATLLGIDPAGLEATVATYNANVLQGADPLFHRGESDYDTQYGPTLAPIEKSPFYGVEVSPADLGTCGGARVNGHAQVLDPFGRTIGRFYAAGNASGVGGPGAGYGGGGGTIGPAMTFAFIAGQHVATLEPQADEA